MSSQSLFVTWVVYIWVTKRHLGGILSSLEKWLIVFCPSFHNYRHGHNPWAFSPPSALVWITHQVPSMAQLRDCYILSWTSSSRVNSGGRRGEAWPPFPSTDQWKALTALIHDPFTACVSLFYVSLSFTHTHTQYVVPSSRQKDGIMSHLSASSCAESAMWDVHSSKWWVGVWVEHGYKLACGHLSSVWFFYLSPLVTLHERRHLAAVSHPRLPEWLWHFESVRHESHLYCMLTERKSSPSMANHVFSTSSLGHLKSIVEICVTSAVTVNLHETVIKMSAVKDPSHFVTRILTRNGSCNILNSNKNQQLNYNFSSELKICSSIGKISTAIKPLPLWCLLT